MKPIRIQRKRTKGWKMPDGAVYVGRPTKWGNPYPVSVYGREIAVKNYRARLEGMKLIGVNVAELRGKNLACWCPLDQPCHADVLLEIANSRPGAGEEREA